MSRERLASILKTMVETVRDPSPPKTEAELSQWLDRQGLETADENAFGAIGQRRLFLYRTLIRKSLRSAVREELPRTALRLGERFDTEVDAFLTEEMPRSHYLRDVAFEMVEWARPRWTADSTLPTFLADLARHELSAFEVAAADVGDPPEADPGLELDRAVVLDPALRVCRYAFPVHRLREEDPDLAPELTTLLVYRDAEHDVRYLELTPLAGLILEHLLAKEPLGVAITTACAALGVGFPVEASARFFADLAERGVLYGAARPTAGVSS
jgi:hypothetical protein